MKVEKPLRILLSAFEPYDDWDENSSWIALMKLLRDRPRSLELVTRRYPVNLQAMRAKLHNDLSDQFDAVLHLGQSPGATGMKLETIALNVAGCLEERGDELRPIVESGPLAFQSQMPLGRWRQLLRERAIPASVSYYAGTFLCNAIMYLSHHWYYERKQNVPVGFFHLPLVTEQAAARSRSLPSLASETLTEALRIVLEDIAAGSLSEPQTQRLA